MSPAHIACRFALVAITLASLPRLSIAQKLSTFSIGELTFDFTDPALAPTTTAQRRFVDAYRAARAAEDLVAMRALVHPASITCMARPHSQSYLAERLQREVATRVPDDASIILIPARPEFTRAPVGEPALTILPVDPAQLLAIDFFAQTYDDKGVLLKSVGTTIVRQLAFDGAELRLVEYCLTPTGEDLYARKRAAGATAPSKP